MQRLHSTHLRDRVTPRFPPGNRSRRGRSSGYTKMTPCNKRCTYSPDPCFYSDRGLRNRIDQLNKFRWRKTEHTPKNMRG
jgi:hypothetical protein